MDDGSETLPERWSSTEFRKHCADFKRQSTLGLGLPVYLAVIKITPKHFVGGHVHIQRHGVLQRWNHLCVLALQQINAADLVAVGEHQVRAFS